MRRASIVSSLLLGSVLVLAGCGGHARSYPPVPRQEPPHVTHEALAVVSRLSHRRVPFYYLGRSYRGLPLVYAETEGGSTASFWYANCTWLEIDSLSPYCTRGIGIESDAVAPGDANAQGRCTWQGSLRGTAVATFPVNPGSLRFFTADATVYVSGGTLAQDLAAARALRTVRQTRPGPVPPRDVSRYLGTCKRTAVSVKPPSTPKERYERAMKRSFAIEFTGAPNLDAFPTRGSMKLVRSMLANGRNVPPALRNVAYRLHRITPPHDVASLHRDLLDELERLADDEDAVDAELGRGESLDRSRWPVERPRAQHTLDADAAAIAKTVAAFRARGYSIYVKPSD